MRPKLLEIEGLQSFTDKQIIDFETLGETGLFGIFGPTGSGKSTILDAITFALYGRVKRAENGTQGIINSNCRSARVSFTFELTKEGNRKTYRVERTYQRKKNAPNSCEPKVARLIEITESGELPLCDKATEVSGYVRELLGLNNEDFTRAVVLPQNSFQDFLLLDNKDRRGMLERIFYLEEYGRDLEDKLKHKMAGMKSRLDMLSGELKAYEDASDEALETAEKAMEEAILERTRIEKTAKESESRYNEAKEVWGFVQEQAEYVRLELEQTASAADTDAMRKSLDRAVKADGLYDSISNVRKVRGRLEDTGRQLAEVASEIPGISDKLGIIKSEYEKLKSEAALEQPRLVGQKARLEDALLLRDEIRAVSAGAAALQAEVTQLRDVESKKAEAIKNLSGQCETLEKESERLKLEIEPLKVDPDYRRHVQDGANRKNEMDTLVSTVKSMEERRKTLLDAGTAFEQKLAGINGELALNQELQQKLSDEKTRHEKEKPADQNSLKKLSDRIHSVQSAYELLSLRQNELDRLKAKAESQKTEAGKLENNALKLEEERQQTAAAVEDSRMAYDKALNASNLNNAYALSKTLRDGEACPVCGSMHHPAPASHIDGDAALLEKMLQEAKDKLDEAEKAHREADRNAIIASGLLKTAREQLEMLLKEIETKTSEFETERQKLPEKLKVLGMDEIRDEIDKANKSYEEKRQLLENWEQRSEKLRQSLDEINRASSEKRVEQNGSITELKGNRENIAQLESSTSEAQKSLEQVTQKYEDFLRTYELKDAVSELERLAENDRKLVKLQSALEKNQEEVRLKRSDAERLKEEWNLLNSERIKKETQENGLNLQKDEKAARLKELAGEAADIGAEIERIDAILGSYVERDGKYRQDIEALERSLNELNSRRTTLENQRGIYSETLKSDEAKLASALSEKGFADENEAEASVIAVEKQAELKAKIEEYDQKLLNIRAQLDNLRKKLKSRSITEDEWNAVSAAWQELSAHREACVAAGEVARNNYRLLKSKHEKWVSLSQKYNELSQKQGLYDQIQKLLKAELRKDNSFIDYIAEERLRYVAANASRTLGIITKQRYMLELDTEAGFIIRDQANGGVHRMVRSLSGGETFLTSLSLALALSEQIQLKGQSPLEFFFLDEGFGTLDQELLDTVIDALERLSSNDRVIGLISHVPELKSRLGRRLVVKPATLQGDGSKVSIEKA
ncbi:MAG TPA: AAA family ATPase [Clostridia bacterium]|nr:AAA family ATPase [Clostridia bacterium]